MAASCSFHLKGGAAYVLALANISKHYQSQLIVESGRDASVSFSVSGIQVYLVLISLLVGKILL